MKRLTSCGSRELLAWRSEYQLLRCPFAMAPLDTRMKDVFTSFRLPTDGCWSSLRLL